MKTLVWFRNDLRVIDHPALHDASAEGPVEAVFLMAARQWRSHDVGDNRLAFLLDTLHRHAADLARLGIPLPVLDVPELAGAGKQRSWWQDRGPLMDPDGDARFGARIVHVRVADPLVQRVLLVVGDRGCAHPTGQSDDGPWRAGELRHV